MRQWLSTALSEASSGKHPHITPPSRSGGGGQKHPSQVSSEEVGSVRLLALNAQAMASTRSSRGMEPWAVYNDLLSVLGFPQESSSYDHGVMIAHHLSDANTPYLIPPVQETVAGTDCCWPWKYKLRQPTIILCNWIYIPSSRVIVALLFMHFSADFTILRDVVDALAFVAPRCNSVFFWIQPFGAFLHPDVSNDGCQQATLRPRI